VIVEGIESAQGLEAVALAGAHGAQGFFIARPSLHGLLDQVVRVEDVLEVLEATEVQDGDELDMALSWSGMERMSALVAASTVSGGAEVSAAETGMGTGFFLQARA
jgi:isopentenyl diphosphate isomerase/L-lactate dehydrogenase-like FMN-dependent dehydrogenase